jgi:arginyl-tRNA synthetase
MSIIKNLTKDIEKIIKDAGYEIENLKLAASGRRDLGEFQINDAMNLSKKYHKNPREIAEDIVKELEKDKRFTNINIAGPGFINISLDNKLLSEEITKLGNNPELNIDKLDPRKVIIDYGGANVAKRLHIGHMRTANIGEALKRLANKLGYKTIGDAHLGDYGRPLGFVVLEIKTRFPELPYWDENYKGDYSEVELNITNEELLEIYPVASAKAKRDPKFLAEGRDITAKIQSGVRGYYDCYKKVVEISMADIKKVYGYLNVSFEWWKGEADSAKYFDELYEILDKKGLTKESDGALIVEVKTDEDKAPMPPVIIKKSNDTVSYETTDLATILQREKDYQPDEIWYVVDERQSLHFEQVFRCTYKAGLVPETTKLIHIPNGTMNGSDGKPFKTRDGGVMGLEELIDLVYEKTYKKINVDTVPEELREKVARTVAIGTLKYSDLLPFVCTNYIFDLDKFSELEGKTAPYLLYSTTRMKSLLQKAGDFKFNTIHNIYSETEKDIVLSILELPRVLNNSLENKSLNEICEYLYTLTSKYNKFYAENKVLVEEDDAKKESWLMLTKLVYDINLMLFDILAIEVPEKM